MSKYYKLLICVPEAEQENVIGMLHWISDFESVEQQDSRMIVSYSLDKQAKESLIQALTESSLDFEYLIEDEEDKNWNEIYEKSFQPLIILDNEWGIRASFHEPLSVKHEIVIDPKMSFGTGHHETTKQMMELMTTVDFVDKAVWDYGAGTGILAIMASKMGADSIKANDNEEWAYRNSLENAALNHCNNISFCLGTIETCEKEMFLLPQSDRFEIIIANITKNILLESALKIEQYSQSGTKLFLSGFYKEDIVDIEKKYQSVHFYIQNQTSLNNWACLLLEKK